MVSISRTESKNLRSLSTRKGRRQLKMFAAEGVRVMEEALRHRFLPTTIYYAPALLSERGKKLVTRFRSARVPIKELSGRHFQSVADTGTPQGIIGVFAMPSLDPAEQFRSTCRRLILCEGIADPGNLGTLARSALAFDFDMLLMVGSSADPYSPKVVRSSTGAVFGLRIARTSHDEFFELVSRYSFKLVAGSKSGSSDIRQLKSVLKSGKLILAIGSESEGLSDKILEGCDLCWEIAHSAKVESLNAAVAGSIIMKQVFDNWR